MLSDATACLYKSSCQSVGLSYFPTTKIAVFEGGNSITDNDTVTTKLTIRK